jgi:hypothetical protein
MRRRVFNVWPITQAPRSYGRLLQVTKQPPHHDLREQRAVLIRPS